MNANEIKIAAENAETASEYCELCNQLPRFDKRGDEIDARWSVQPTNGVDTVDDDGEDFTHVFEDGTRARWINMERAWEVVDAPDEDEDEDGPEVPTIEITIGDLCGFYGVPIPEDANGEPRWTGDETLEVGVSICRAPSWSDGGDLGDLSDMEPDTEQFEELVQLRTAQITTRGAICDEPLSVGSPAEEIVLLGCGRVIFASRWDDDRGDAACRRWAEKNGWIIA